MLPSSVWYNKGKALRSLSFPKNDRKKPAYLAQSCPFSSHWNSIFFNSSEDKKSHYSSIQSSWHRDLFWITMTWMTENVHRHYSLFTDIIHQTHIVSIYDSLFFDMQHKLRRNQLCMYLLFVYRFPLVGKLEFPLEK